jgi:large subunit ribosomal protein L4
MKLKVIRTTSRDSSITVSDQIFDKKNDQLLAQAVLVYLSNKRQGTSKTQTRSEVSRTTRKWYRQKGTGNARHGARDATLFVGGAVAHGPTGIENWKKTLTKKQKKQALVAALSAQVENIVINDEILELSGKTKQAAELLTKIIQNFNEDLTLAKTKILIVADKKNDKLNQATSNLSNVKILLTNQLNALVVSQADLIIMTNPAVSTLEKQFEA